MENKKETPVSTTCKFKFVTAIMALFNLGDEGKFVSFFSRLERDFNRAIEQLKINLNILKSQHDQEMTELKEQLEDAVQSVEDAWLNVKPEQIATNALQESFKESYLAAIERAEDEVERIEERIEKVKDRYKEDREAINKQIKAYEARINKLIANK